jgi:chromosome segregation ATPase
MTQQHMTLARVDQDSKIKIEELTTALRQQDIVLRTRDEEVNKLREDNQNMFKDLREYAESEEGVKLELQENKARRLELETMCEDLKERTHNQELKVRNMGVELDKVRREAAMKTESQRYVEKDLESVRAENESLRDRLIQLETERANFMNERERKDRESKHLQNEVNRMNQMV